MRRSERLSAGALFLCLLLALPHPLWASTSQRIPALVDKYAARYGIPLYIARNLVRAESGGRQSAQSPTGARGVMQLTPATARALGVDINDPEQNIEGGMRYLRQQYDRFGRWDLALAAYRSGPQAVIRYNGVPPGSQAYVRKILGTSTGASTESPPRHPTSAERKDDAPRLGRGFLWPVQGVVGNGFGRRGGRHHTGIDILAPQGTPIRAAGPGTVTLSDWYYNYGRTVMVDHGGGVSTLYGHASALLVVSGETVQAGQVIAHVGCSGRCTGSHVHFEVRVNDVAVDPLSPPGLMAAKPAARKSSAKVSPTAVKSKTTSRPTVARQRSVTVTGDTTTTVTDEIRNGQVVWRVEVVLFVQGPLRIRILREFRIARGVLELVKERMWVQVLDEDDEDDEDEEDDEDDD